MSSLDDLKLVLKDALDNKGVVNEVKAKLRAEVFSILDDNLYEKPKSSQENLLINELIREYMDFNYLKYSKSVFLKETNQPNDAINREIIAAELHIKEDNTTRQVPLIYTLIWDFLNKEDTNQPRSEEGVAKTNTGSQMREINKKELSKNINIYKYNQEQFD